MCIESRITNHDSRLLRPPCLESRIFTAAVADSYFGDHRARRAAPGPRDDGVDQLGATLDHGFHRAVAAVAHPAGDAQFARQALKEAETSLGPDHRTTESSLSTLSLALRLGGRPDEALPIAQRLVVVRTKQYGPEDPATAIALHNNAEILIAQGQFAEAATLEGRALAVFQKKLGANHFNTAAALHNMGAILLKQEKYKEAENYLRRALAAKEKSLKPGHLSLAHTLDNLSTALDAQGRQIEAEKYKRRADGIRKKAG